MAATLSWPGGLELKMAWDGTNQKRTQHINYFQRHFLMKDNPLTNTGSGQTEFFRRC